MPRPAVGATFVRLSICIYRRMRVINIITNKVNYVLRWPGADGGWDREGGERIHGWCGAGPAVGGARGGAPRTRRLSAVSVCILIKLVETHHIGCECATATFERDAG